MSYYNELRGKIEAKIEAFQGQGRALIGAWPAHAICDDHAEGLADHEDAEFWQHRAYRTVREEVRRYIGKRFGDGPGRAPEQETFPGPWHLRGSATAAGLVRERGDAVSWPRSTSKATRSAFGRSSTGGAGPGSRPAVPMAACPFAR